MVCYVDYCGVFGTIAFDIYALVGEPLQSFSAINIAYLSESGPLEVLGKPGHR